MAEWYVKALPEHPVTRRKLMLAAGAGVALVALAGALWSNASSGGGEVVATDPGISVSAPPIAVVVQVVGAVKKPGVYQLNNGARVMDAVDAAGGLASNAKPASLNLARLVQDGEQVVVGRTGRGGASSTGTSNAATDHVNINTGSAADFETLPRIGTTLAERIVAYRDAHGPFAQIESLMDVPGIGQVTFDGMRDSLTL